MAYQEIQNNEGGLSVRNKLNSMFNELYQSKIIIPKLFMRVKRFTDENFDPTTGNITDKLIVWWEAEDKEFLNHNPQIWLFVHRRNRRKLANGVLVKRAYVHPPHQNGTNFPHSNYFGGEATNKLGQPFDTEFQCPLNSREEIILPLNPYQWVIREVLSDGSWEAIDENTDLQVSGYNYKFTGRSTSVFESQNGQFRRTINFKLAIAVDNPEQGPPKMFGPLSDKFSLKLAKTGSRYKLTYQLDR